MADDFSCPNFSPQKWRKDVCRNCYQPLKVHSKKQPSLSRTNSIEAEPKVFQRIKVEKPTIDKSIPAKERTTKLESIQPGIVKNVQEIATKPEATPTDKPSPAIAKKSHAIKTRVGSITRPKPPAVLGQKQQPKTPVAPVEVTTPVTKEVTPATEESPAEVTIVTVQDSTEQPNNTTTRELILVLL